VTGCIEAASRTNTARASPTPLIRISFAAATNEVSGRAAETSVLMRSFTVTISPPSRLLNPDYYPLMAGRNVVPPLDDSGTEPIVGPKRSPAGEQLA
jgi:hypothetical protein